MTATACGPRNHGPNATRMRHAVALEPRLPGRRLVTLKTRMMWNCEEALLPPAWQETDRDWIHLRGEAQDEDFQGEAQARGSPMARCARSWDGFGIWAMNASISVHPLITCLEGLNQQSVLVQRVLVGHFAAGSFSVKLLS